jgi:hypothetical protein
MARPRAIDAEQATWRCGVNVIVYETAFGWASNLASDSTDNWVRNLGNQLIVRTERDRERGNVVNKGAARYGDL